jgi:hypothetical protein
VDDLTKKLQSMQSSLAERQRALTINTAVHGGAEAGRRDVLLSPSPAHARGASASERQALPEGGKGLRAMRSFRRPATAGGAPREEAPMPVDAEGRVRRSTTMRRPADDSRANQSQGEEDVEGRVRRSTTTRRPAEDSRAYQSQGEEGVEGRVRRSTTTRRPAADDPRAVHPGGPKERALTMPAFLSDPPQSPPLASSPLPASMPMPMAVAAQTPGKLTKAPPVGVPVPVRASAETPPQAHRHAASKSGGTLTRVFVGDMQRFNMVDIGPATSAKHVLAMVEEQGALKGWVGTGGWMVWEVAQDFGMGECE